MRTMSSTFLLIALALILGLVGQLRSLYLSALAAQNAQQNMGYPLATEVANYLEQQHVIAPSHTYYGGMGLGFNNGVFVYARVYEGELARKEEVVSSASTDYREFLERNAFIDWLAAQSDQSLDAKNNHCLSKVALAKTVKFHL